jgi:hypothetical protein
MLVLTAMFVDMSYHLVIKLLYPNFMTLYILFHFEQCLGLTKIVPNPICYKAYKLICSPKAFINYIIIGPINIIVY